MRFNSETRVLYSILITRSAETILSSSVQQILYKLKTVYFSAFDIQ